MWSAILEPYNQPFAVALVVMLGIGLLEGLAAMLGAGLSSLLDSLLPDFDADVDVLPASIDGDGAAGLGPAAADGAAGLGPAAADGAAGRLPTVIDGDIGPLASTNAGLMVRLLGWLQVGRVPVLVLLVLLLLGYGLSGLLLQAALIAHSGEPLGAGLASIPAAALGVSFMRGAGAMLAKIIPRDETTAVSTTTFVGRPAKLLAADAQTGHGAQARLKDEHGQAHYIMVEPENPEITLRSGTQIQITGQRGAMFLAKPSSEPEDGDSKS